MRQRGKPITYDATPEGGVTGHGRIIERNMRTGDERPVYRFESQVAGGFPILHLAVSWDGIHLAFLETIGTRRQTNGSERTGREWWKAKTRV